MKAQDDEEELLRSVALQNAKSILMARERAERDLVQAREALQQKAEELAQSLEVLRATLESTDDGILVVDHSGKVTTYNQQFVNLWKIPSEVVASRDLQKMRNFAAAQLRNPEAFIARAEEIYSSNLEESSDHIELADGRIFERTSKNQRVGNQAVVRVWNYRDVTGRKQAEDALREESRILDLLNSTGQAIASKLNLEALVQTVTDAGTELSGAKFGAFFYNVINAQGESLLLFSLSGAPREAFEKFGLPRATPIFKPTFHNEGVVRSNDITQDPRYGTMAPHHGMPKGHLPVRSYLAAPVVSRSGEVIGGLFFGHPEPGIFTERSERLILGIAAQAAVGIDNARLYEAAQNEIKERKAAEAQLAERAKLASLRGDMAPFLTLFGDLPVTLQGCCKLLLDHLDATFARIWIKSDEENVLVLRASAGLSADFKGPEARIPVGAYTIGQIGENHRLHVWNGEPNDTVVSAPDGPLPPDVIAFAGYPLISEDRLLGVLAVCSTSKLSDAVIGDLASISDSIATSIARRKAEAELIAAKNRAEVASRAKDEFLARLSHELRTPLTPVLMTAAALRDDENVPASIRSDMAMIERNVGLEARLIDDLLDLTRVTAGKLQLREEICDAHSLITMAAEILRDEVQTKPLSLELHLKAGRTALQCDPARIQQVIWNLLRNSIKFTPVGGKISIRTCDGENACLRVEVEDTGIGLSAKSLASIFEPFEQAGRENDHRFGGVGLGLTITRAIVELHGGSIRAESAGPGLGSTFIVELPRAQTRDVHLDQISDDTHSPTKTTDQEFTASLRLLLVEDHEPTLAVMSRMLLRRGHHVVTANNLETALEAAKTEKFDIVVSDLGLPDGTGLELFSKLRGFQPELQGIALSGYGMDDDLRRSVEVGFSLHLTKPVDFEHLIRSIASLRRNLPK